MLLCLVLTSSELVASEIESFEKWRSCLIMQYDCDLEGSLGAWVLFLPRNNALTLNLSER